MTTRTYHPRQGRVSARHRTALADLWPRYGVDATAPLRAGALFGRELPIVLEIGSGMGEATLAMAAADPERGYLAVEIHRPGLGNLVALTHELGLDNLRVYDGDALRLLEHQLAPASLDAVHVFFPDPWPKARHHKRRLIEPTRLGLIASRLRPGGILHCATDAEGYAQAMLAAVTASTAFVNAYPAFAPRPAHRPETKFERRGIDAGRAIFDLIVTRTADEGIDGAR